MYPHSRRFLKEYTPGKGSLYLWGIISLLLTILCTAIVPRYIKAAVNLLNHPDFTDKLQQDELLFLAICILLVGIALCIFRSLSRILIFLPGRKIEAELRQELFEAVVSLPQSRLDSFESGDLISRGTNDIASVRVMISMGVLHSINSPVMIIACLYFMFATSIKMTLLCLLPLPLVIIGTRYLSKKLIVIAKETQNYLGKLTERIREQFRAHSLMRIYSVFDILHAKFTKENEHYNTLAQRQMTIRTYMLTTIVLLSSFGIYLLIRFGGAEAISGGDFDIGSFVAFSLYLVILLGPLRALGWLLSVMQRGEVCLERFYLIKDEAIQYRDEQAKRQFNNYEKLQKAYTKTDSLVELKDLKFAYQKQGAEAEEKFSLDIPELKIQQGKKYGLFGKTGSGKSTLLKLISNSLSPNSGSASFRGVPFEEISAELISRQFSQVPQDCRHFSGTLKANLELASDDQKQDDSTQNSFEDAYDISCLRSDVEKLSQGFDTILGEQGINLSGGQRQRLAIMRALLRARQILIMDDFVSAVDHKTEKEIIEKLYQKTQEQTAILSSHRISALQECDKIFIIEDGKVSNSGTHQELVQSSKFYADTWAMQLNADQESEELYDV